MSGFRQEAVFQKGFTLVEMLLSVAIIGLLAGLSVPLFQSFEVKNDLDIASGSVAQAFRRAQLLSEASEGDSVWGVKIQSGSIVIFKGTSYAARDLAADEISDLPSTLTPGGMTEITFAKMTGLPNAAGTLTLSSVNGDTESISINQKGTVVY